MASICEVLFISALLSNPFDIPAIFFQYPPELLEHLESLTMTQRASTWLMTTACILGSVLYAHSSRYEIYEDRIRFIGKPIVFHDLLSGLIILQGVLVPVISLVLTTQPGGSITMVLTSCVLMAGHAGAARYFGRSAGEWTIQEAIEAIERAPLVRQIPDRRFEPGKFIMLWDPFLFPKEKFLTDLRRRIDNSPPKIAEEPSISAQ